MVSSNFVHCHYMGSMIKQSVTVLKVVSSITINKMSQQIIGWLALGGECLFILGIQNSFLTVYWSTLPNR